MESLSQIYSLKNHEDCCGLCVFLYKFYVTFVTKDEITAYAWRKVVVKLTMWYNLCCSVSEIQRDVEYRVLIKDALMLYMWVLSSLFLVLAVVTLLFVSPYLYQSWCLPSSPQDPLLPTGLPIHLTHFFLCLRFGFCWPLCVFLNYIFTYSWVCICSYWISSKQVTGHAADICRLIFRKTSQYWKLSRHHRIRG